ncbi:MAG: rod shape-determining protein MreD [Bacillota bacterium]|nr:rod shape-determining protein MreD [Bacillota bacterium]
MERRYSAIRYLAYIIEIIVFYSLSSTPGLIPNIFGGAPIFLLPIAITIAVFENEISGMFIGLFCGILLDVCGSYSQGFFAITLAILCFFLGFLSDNYIKIKFLTIIFTAVLIIVVLLSLHFFFFFVLQDYSDSGWFFMQHYLSRIICTIAVTPIIYFLNKLLAENIREQA